MRRSNLSRSSAPECQLLRRGTEGTYSLLLDAAHELSAKSLAGFEEEIDFFSKTGLIGVQMSKMLALIEAKQSDMAA